MDKIQSRGTDFIERFTDSFRFDRDTTSSRLGVIKLYKRISEPLEYVAVKSISFAELDPLALKNLQLFYSQNGQFIGTQHNVHPNLTQLYGLNVSHGNQKVDLYLEYCSTTIKEQINLRLQHSLHFSPQELWRTTLSVILAAEYLQTHGAFIGDVRTSRIFINKKGLVKVVPFMQSQHDIDCYQRCTFYGDHSCFLSPELLQQSKYHSMLKLDSQTMHKNDVFGLGLSILEMATLRDSIELIDWERYSIKSSVMQVRIDFAKSLYGEFFGQILQNMLGISESERSTFNELLSLLFPYQEAIITGVGFDQMPQLHSRTNFEIKKLNEIKNTICQNDNHVNDNIITNTGMSGQNNQFNKTSNNFIKIDIFSTNEDSIMDQEKKKESNQIHQPNYQQAIEIQNTLQSSQPISTYEARISQNNQIPSFITTKQLNIPFNQTAKNIQKTFNSPIRVENHMLDDKPKSTNNNTNHFELQNSSIESIPTETQEENNKELNQVKYFQNINNNNSNLSSRSSQTVSTKAFGEKLKNEEQDQIIQNQNYNQQIKQNQIVISNHINHSLSPASQRNFELNNSVSKEPIVSFTDLSQNKFFYNPQIKQSYQNFQKDIHNNDTNTNQFSLNNSLNVPNKSNQKVFSNKVLSSNQTQNSTYLPNTIQSKDLSSISSNENLNYYNHNKSLVFQNQEMISQQVPVQVSAKSTVLPCQFQPKNQTYLASDYRKQVVPVKKIILNSILQPLAANNSQPRDTSLSSSIRNIQQHHPIVQINLSGDQQQVRTSSSVIRAGPCSRSVSPQSYLIQRQIVPPAGSIIIRKNSLPTQQINLCSTPIKQLPQTNMLYYPESNSRQLSPVIRFQQVNTPQSTQKIISATTNSFFTPQHTNFTSSQVVKRELNFEQEKHQQPQQQTAIVSRGRQHNHVELFKKEYQLK